MSVLDDLYAVHPAPLCSAVGCGQPVTGQLTDADGLPESYCADHLRRVTAERAPQPAPRTPRRSIVRVDEILVERSLGQYQLGKWVDAYEVETSDGVAWYIVEVDRGGRYGLHRVEHPSEPLATAVQPMELLGGILAWTEDGFVGWDR